MTRKPWTDIELRIVREHYADSSTADIARALNRSERVVWQMANKVGVKKSRLLMQQLGRKAAENPKTVATRFKPGATPHNKGLRRPGWARGRMKETQFTKGQRPPNSVPIGTVRERDGYLYVKLRESNVPGGSRHDWELIHRLCWEAYHGPIPKSHALRFRTRSSSAVADIRIENLELVSRSELLRQNSIYNYPPELVQVIKQRAGLVRRINNKLKEQNNEDINQPPT